jgi:mRNA-degrading endonuclease YafQ of YafQ-DinJ toxin-antitoxin module
MHAALHRNFKKQFKKLPSKIQQRFFDRVDIFIVDKFNPVLNHHSVDSVYPGWFSINITGDYRALYEPASDSVVIFMKIGTHSELYG